MFHRRSKVDRSDYRDVSDDKFGVSVSASGRAIALSSLVFFIGSSIQPALF
ncbi:hypothetical protein H6F93_04560 [Leptolyngbya sp. FACHB-671]|uniref:hypothetical protein n=1 Tax=Leptolyngbya sp. FACHB-671 TaxID=2692812 RepID=UPI00168397B1|nr:hypothetical protein [Leptolyngbya sp. FACHB-671]MBD2066805.1 hypothetical protein [Leptolyngbya sp. FACHB-671]